MNLHIMTLLWVLGLSYSVNVLFALALRYGGNHFPGSLWWIFAQGTVALGTFLVALRLTVPYPLLALGNTLLLAAGLMYALSVWIFRYTEGFPKRLFLILPVFFGLLLSMEGTTVNARNMVFSGAEVLVCLWIFYILVSKPQPGYGYSSWMTGLSFLFIALGNLAQFVSSLVSSPTYNFQTMNQTYGLMLLLSILTAPVSLFGYFLLATTYRARDLENQSRKLARLNEELRKASHVKDLFVSLMAHDLRAPAGGAARYVRKHLLAPGADLESKRDALETLAVSLEKTSSFLENVLWWSRSQRGENTLNFSQLDLREICLEGAGILGPLAEGKQITLTVGPDEARALADRDSLVLIVQNLVSNAVKFSPPGSEVELDCGYTPEGLPFVRITDHGIGIPREVRERLFQIENKITTLGTSGELGNGMGLILCYEFAKLNKGTLILTSEPEMGTTVMVRLLPWPRD